MWSGKFMTRSGTKGYHFELTGAKTILAYGAEETVGKEFPALKLFNLTAYNELVLAQ